MGLLLLFLVFGFAGIGLLLGAICLFLFVLMLVKLFE